MPKSILFIMPFDEKPVIIKTDKGPKTKMVDFNKKYSEMESNLIEKNQNYKIMKVPNIVGADIYNKMYRLIHAADIVIADITGLNANVMYELGARHALRNTKTIIIKDADDFNKIPFDINTYVANSWEGVLKRWDSIVGDKKNDSPIKKEISEEFKDDMDVIEGYVDNWTYFFNEYDELEFEDWEAKHLVLEKYKGDFLGLEEFDQKYCLNIYKMDPSLEGNENALKVIERHNPFSTENYETIGLACSILRNIVEYTSSKEMFDKLFDLSRKFISLYKAPYSYSSYITALIIGAENKLIDVSYAEKEIDFYFGRFEDVQYSLDKKWFGDTKLLFESLKSLQIKDGSKEKTKEFVGRWIKLKGGRDE